MPGAGAGGRESCCLLLGLLGLVARVSCLGTRDSWLVSPGARTSPLPLPSPREGTQMSLSRAPKGTLAFPRRANGREAALPYSGLGIFECVPASVIEPVLERILESHCAHAPVGKDISGIQGNARVE